MEKLMKGKENKQEVLDRLGLKSETVRMKYFLINGIPHKPNSKGEMVPLKLKAIRYKSDCENESVSKKIVNIPEQLPNKDSHEQLPLAS